MEIKTFAAPSRAEAENAATGWWSQQTGLARISEFAAPINSSDRRSAAARWKVTVVFVRTALPDTELDWGVSGAQSPWRRASTLLRQLPLLRQFLTVEAADTPALWRQ